ncbi:MAG: hypothetical protein PHX68_00990 [Alphaproteobacteria bacterium]|nr:hypothetical protein [Alphaproteobacteria bacterium]
MSVQFLKDLIRLDKPVLNKKLAEHLAPRVHAIYYTLLFILGLMFLGALSMLWTAGLSWFVLSLVWNVLLFIVVRMWCEFLAFGHKADK